MPMIKMMTVSYPEIFFRAETNNNSAARFFSSQRRKVAIPHEPQDHRKTWLQIQKCVEVWKTQLAGSMR